MDNELRIDAILDFWFGRPREYLRADDARIRFWFGGAPEVNREIKARFSVEWQQAAEGGLDHWASSQNGLLALVILLDQFSRNLHRDSGRAFACDPQALQFCLSAIDNRRDAGLQPLQRLFLYLPLEHAEDLQMQTLSVEKFSDLAEHAPAGMDKTYRGFLEYAERHKAVIERFGRFPHRNALLGRVSRAEETAFLAQPGSSFM